MDLAGYGLGSATARPAGTGRGRGQACEPGPDRDGSGLGAYRRRRWSVLDPVACAGPGAEQETDRFSRCPPPVGAAGSVSRGGCSTRSAVCGFAGRALPPLARRGPDLIGDFQYALAFRRWVRVYRRVCGSRCPRAANRRSGRGRGRPFTNSAVAAGTVSTFVNSGGARDE